MSSRHVVSSAVVGRDRSAVRVLLLAVGLSGACATAQRGATEANLAQAQGQAGPGATLFASSCAGCHGPRGEGLGSAPALLGPGALPEFPRTAGGSGDPTLIDPQQLQIEMQSRPAGAPTRDPFRNAGDLFRFVRTKMPKNHPGSLTDGDAWAVVNFILAAQGASLPPGGVGPANAAVVPVPHL
jgi:mono/diheme cytochrome c family protein